VNIEELAKRFVANPFPLWEVELTKTLVEHKWENLCRQGIVGLQRYYNTTNAYYKKNYQTALRGKSLLANQAPNTRLEFADFEYLTSFYNEHGLDPLNVEETTDCWAVEKLNAALELLDLVPGCLDCVSQLVRSIQVLRQPEPEYDVSYSHPDIPFTIFVSVGEEDTSTANLRLAESILHEAMHLKLTLIETVLPIIAYQTTATFYSPWRSEERPIQGVMHALFVFSTIAEFYNQLYRLEPLEENLFINYRLEDIKSEVLLINNFSNNSGLTCYGSNLAFNLISHLH